MSQPNLDSTPIGTNTTNSNISHLGSTTVGTNTPDPKVLTLPTELSKRKEKAQKEYVPEDPESDPSSSESSSRKSNLCDDSKYIKSKVKERDKKKNH